MNGLSLISIGFLSGIGFAFGITWTVSHATSYFDQLFSFSGINPKFSMEL